MIDDIPGGEVREVFATEAFNHYLRKAKEKGINRPVLLLLSDRSSHAQHLFIALTGKAMQPPRDTEEEWGPLETADPVQAASLLRQHAGQAGALAADHIQDPLLQADWWIILVMIQ